jgi:hypothetical protein
MSDVADSSPKAEPRDWLWLGNDSSRPNQFDETLKDAFLQFRDRVGPGEAAQRLTALVCQWPSMPVMKCVTSNGKETWSLVPVEDFQNEVISLSPGIDATTGTDCLDIDYPKEYVHPSVIDDRRVEFWVRSADRARELERLAASAAPLPPPDKEPTSTSAPAPPSAPSQEPASTSAPSPLPALPREDPNRTLRRWSAKHEWDAIYAEIARRCIDPKTRQVKVPKNELKLAEDIRLRWCADTNRSAPGLTDMRAAVHAICVALRKI